MRDARKHRRMALSLSCGLLAMLVVEAASASRAGVAADGGPSPLSFEELGLLSEMRDPPVGLASRVRELLRTPFVSNAAHRSGATPFRPASRDLGPLVRVALWNIERGARFDDLRLILAEPERLRRRLSEARLDEDERREALEQASWLQAADVLVLNEVDLGMPRSGYRDVARELAESLGMNFAFGAQFVEVDRRQLELDGSAGSSLTRGEGTPALSVHPRRYRGLHGLAVLSRYPIRRARLVPFDAQPYDWFAGESAGTSLTEKAKRRLAKWAFSHDSSRQIRRGGRGMLIVDLALTDRPEATLTVVATQLENRTKPSGRRRQMAELLEELRGIANPVLVAGDLNTTGKDHAPTSISRELRGRYLRADGWIRRLAMKLTGVGMIFDLLRTATAFLRAQHDPTIRGIPLLAPNRERELFQELERMRFDDGGACDFRGERELSWNGKRKKLANSNERGFKGFVSTFQFDRTYLGVGKFKLDWILVKAYLTEPHDAAGSRRLAPHRGRTLRALNKSLPERVSDHDPLTVDLPLHEPAAAVPGGCEVEAARSGEQPRATGAQEGARRAASRARERNAGATRGCVGRQGP